MDVDTQVEGYVNEVEVDVSNVAIIYHSIYFVAISAILLLTIDKNNDKYIEDIVFDSLS